MDEIQKLIGETDGSIYKARSLLLVMSKFNISEDLHDETESGLLGVDKHVFISAILGVVTCLDEALVHTESITDMASKVKQKNPSTA